MDEQGKLIDEPEPAAPGNPKVAVGTSGYSFDDWIGNFYPAHIRKGDMLREYTKHFSAVEVNSTYYRVPGAAMLARMVEKTPAWFEFVIKANQEMTHKASKDAALYERFAEALKPVIAAGKFRGIIAQFPWGFKPTEDAREHLGFLRAKFDEIPGAGAAGGEGGRCPLFVELRNAEWIDEDLFESFKAQGLGYCSVDEPHLRGLVPPVARLTTDLGYVRFHGRNAQNWWAGGRAGAQEAGGKARAAGDRYDYLYSEAELREWVVKIKAMAQAARKTYVFFNNCHAGQAARNAAMMKELLNLAL